MDSLDLEIAPITWQEFSFANLLNNTTQLSQPSDSHLWAWDKEPLKLKKHWQINYNCLIIVLKVWAYLWQLSKSYVWKILNEDVTIFGWFAKKKSSIVIVGCIDYSISYPRNNNWDKLQKLFMFMIDFDDIIPCVPMDLIDCNYFQWPIVFSFVKQNMITFANIKPCNLLL